MNKARKKRFEKAGWKVGSADEFLGLSEVESALVDTKLALGDAVRVLRGRRHLSQHALAELMGSSQSRVAKLENSDPDASLDLHLRAVFAVNPSARRDVQGLVRKWMAAGAPPARNRRPKVRPRHALAVAR